MATLLAMSLAGLAPSVDTMLSDNWSSWSDRVIEDKSSSSEATARFHRNPAKRPSGESVGVRISSRPWKSVFDSTSFSSVTSNRVSFHTGASTFLMSSHLSPSFSLTPSACLSRRQSTAAASMPAESFLSGSSSNFSQSPEKSRILFRSSTAVDSIISFSVALIDFVSSSHFAAF